MSKKEKENESSKTVKKETMWIVALIAVIVGFLGGVVFGIYKSDTGKPFRNPMVSQPAEKKQEVSADQAAQIFKLEKMTKENPNDVAAWTNLGNLYFDTGNFKEAITAYKKSLALNPNNADVLTDLGVMFRRTGQPQKAVEAFDKAAKVDPHHETSLYNKGIVLMHDLNDFKGAVKAWEELLKRNPSATSPSGQPIKDLIKKIQGTMKQ